MLLRHSFIQPLLPPQRDDILFLHHPHSYITHTSLRISSILHRTFTQNPYDYLSLITTLYFLFSLYGHLNHPYYHFSPIIEVENDDEAKAGGGAEISDKAVDETIPGEEEAEAEFNVRDTVEIDNEAHVRDKASNSGHEFKTEGEAENMDQAKDQAVPANEAVISIHSTTFPDSRIQTPDGAVAEPKSKTEAPKEEDFTDYGLDSLFNSKDTQRELEVEVEEGAEKDWDRITTGKNNNVQNATAELNLEEDHDEDISIDWPRTIHELFYMICQYILLGSLFLLLDPSSESKRYLRNNMNQCPGAVTNPYKWQTTLLSIILCNQFVYKIRFDAGGATTLFEALLMAGLTEGGGWEVLTCLYILWMFRIPPGTGIWAAVLGGSFLGFITFLGVGW